MRYGGGMRRLLPIGLALLAACSADGRAAPPEPPPVPAPLDHARHGHRVHLVDGRLILFGGYSGADAPDRGKRQAFAFEFGKEAWTRIADLGTGMAFHSSAVAGGRVHAIGGTVERYDAAEDRWEPVVREVLLPESHLAAAALGGRIWTVGGFDAGPGGVRVLDPDTGEVSDGPELPGFEPGDHFHVVAALEGRLHVLGGLRKDGLSARHRALVEGRWEVRAPLPEPDWAKFGYRGVVGGRLYVFGEVHHRYDPEADEWEERAAPPEVRAMAAVYVHGTRIIVLGGRPDPDRTVLVYDTEADEWSTAGGR